MLKTNIMKGLIIIIFILATSSIAFSQDARFHIKAGVGIDLLGNHKTIISGIPSNAAVDPGFSADMELGTKFNILFIGAGFEAQIQRRQTYYPGNFLFMPFFFYLEINPYFDLLSPYIFGKIGYNLVYSGDIQYTGTYGKLTGGIYWGVGCGIDLFHFKNIFNNPIALFIEASYSINYGSFYDSYYSISAKIEYSKINIRIGTRTFF